MAYKLQKEVMKCAVCRYLQRTAVEENLDLAQAFRRQGCDSALSALIIDSFQHL